MEETSRSILGSRNVQNTLKFGLITVLALFLFIPKFMILDLIKERETQSKTVIQNVSDDWAKQQIIQGPILVIPYTTKEVIQSNGKESGFSMIRRNLIIFPKDLKIDGNLSTTKKYRSLYEVLLYKSELQAKGTFQFPKTEEININPDQFILNEAQIVMGINDLKGIEDKVIFNWAGKPLELKPGTNEISFNQEYHREEDATYPVAQANSLGKSGLNTKVTITSLEETLPFDLKIKLKGSKNLLFTPYGQQTEVNLSSTFPDPIFHGNFLPSHTTNKSGFKANWKILEYNKNLPSFQKGNDNIDASGNVFGVEIKNLVDHYTKINRATKYMFLVIVLVFLVVFITELINEQRIHIFQYALVGFAIALFFILLLSISEFLGFDKSYIIAAFAIIGLTFLYAKSIFNNVKSTYTLLGLMVFIFSYIYLIIQLEKSALLVGSIGLFIILAATMYVTRKIKWYEE